MKITYLLSHVPHPRFYKKIKAAKTEFKVSVIYCNKNAEKFQTFFKDEEIEKYELLDYRYKTWKVPINWYYTYMKKAINQLKILRPHLIHCGNLDMLLIAYLYMKKYDKKVRIVYEIGDLNKRTYNNVRDLSKIFLKKILIKLESILCKNIDLLILSSPYFWDVYYSNFVPKDKVFLYPNAPEKSIFGNITYEANNDKSNTITIGFIGSVRYFNQLKMVVDVIDKINYRNIKNKYEFFVAGIGPETDKLSNYVKNKDFVKLYGPYNYDEEIVSLYSKIDIVYSVYDSTIQNVKVALPNRLYEAIVTERPIIVASNTMLSKIVLENKIGFAVDSNNESELYDLLMKICNEKIDLKIISNNCKKIKEKYFVDYYNEKLIKAYKSLLN